MTRREFLEASTSVAALPAIAKAGALATAPVDEPSWSLANQRQRRREIYALHQRFMGPLFDPQGNWMGKGHGPPGGSGRELLWNALSFLQSKDAASKGNGLVQRLISEHTGREGAEHFINMATVQVLLCAKELLEPAVAERLRLFLRKSLIQTAGDPIEFLGYNDNFPSMETMFSVLGGDLLEEAPSQKRGLEGIERCLELLERRGLLSEYSSPTYSPISLLCFAEIAERAQNTKTAALGLQVERRIWQDLALHFHAPTNVLSGPHSRAYEADSAGHPHQVQMVLYQTFGKEIWMTPVRYFYPSTPKQVVHGNDQFMQTSNAWLASGTYHPDAEIHRLLFAKKFPLRVAATAEEGSYPMTIELRGPDPKSPLTESPELFEYAATEILSRTYMTEDFAVGTSSGQAHRYQSDAFFVNFRRAQAPAQLADVSTIFCRYATDDHWPGVPWQNPRNPGEEPNADLFAEEGRCHAVQKDATALVVYQSKGELLDDFKSLRLTLVVPTMYRPLRGIWYGEQRVESLPFAGTDPQTIWLEDDFLLASFRPLLASDLGRPYAVLIREINGYLTISFINYQGEPKRFSRKELLLTRNGFVAELSSPSKQSLAAFRQRLAAATLREELARIDQRTVEYRRPGVRLSLSHSLYYDGLKFASINSKQQPRPRLEYSEGV